MKVNHVETISEHFFQDHQRNLAILSALGSSVFIIDRDGTILDFLIIDSFPLANHKKIEQGSNLSALLDEKIDFIAKKKINSCLATGIMQSFVFQLDLQEQAFFIETRIAAMGENQAMVIFKVISDEIRLDQVKSDFINRATHDLRAPVSTALLLINLLEKDIPEEEKREYWNLLKNVLHRESDLVEDLLSFGKLENERWIKNVELLDPIEALEKTYRSILPAAKQKNMHIEYDIPSDDSKVYADRIALEEIFTNLLSNAVKYTPQDGMIKIECKNQADRVSFCIQDSGIGIPEEDLALIGSRNYRGKNALEMGIEGNGIGMFIVKTIIDHFGGNLRVESELGKGTTVSFWIPK